VGEIVSYPREWFPSLDAVMNFTLRQIILRLMKGELDAKTAALMTERMMTEAGIEPMLKSWVLLDNHDLDRLKSTLPDEAQRRLAQVLQFTLPGSPNLYYGSEIDMEGVGDPGMRAPMRWDWVTKDNRTLAWTKQLIALHQQHRALRIGNFRPVSANKLFAFERYTNRAEDTMVVIANPTDAAITESVMIANSKLMNAMKLVSVLDTSAQPAYLDAGFIRVTLPAHGALVLKADTSAKDGYSAYKRVQ
jgi:glycosidase